MSDLVKRLMLRAVARISLKSPTLRDKFDAALDEEAAARIEALEAEVQRLREALRPFADFGSWVDEEGWSSNIHREGISVWFGPSDFRRARAAMEPTNE